MNKLTSIKNFLDNYYEVLYKNKDKIHHNYYNDSFLEIKNICYIYLFDNELDLIFIKTKKELLNILPLLVNYDFDVAPIRDYYNDLNIKGMNLDKLINIVKTRNNRKYYLTLILPINIDNKKLSDLINTLNNDKAYMM